MADFDEQDLAKLNGRQLLARAMQMYSGQPDVAALNEYAGQRQKQGQMDMMNALAAQYAGKGFQPVQESYLKRSLAAQSPQDVGDYGFISGGKFTASPFAGRKEQASAMLNMGNNILDNEEATARQEASDRRADARQAASDRRYYDAEERRNRLDKEKEDKAAAKEALRAKARSDTADVVLGTIADAKNVLKNTSSSPIVRLGASHVPGTDSYTLARKIDTIKANIGFDELQAMREASPTGGALGQVAVQEINYLQSTLGSLDIGLPSHELEKNFDAINRHYNNIKMIQQGKMPPEYGGGTSSNSSSALSQDEQNELDTLRRELGGRK